MIFVFVFVVYEVVNSDGVPELGEVAGFPLVGGPSECSDVFGACDVAPPVGGSLLGGWLLGGGVSTDAAFGARAG
ncbi:hypothetical protein [Yinghuangia seranimata]|uniref:hypothetical protein n=1 Tax=Yinghuangia seranimata TaxID=408067 RepID=UPI00248B3711|nr:hypothetical protein [Yinghuangia seranimata]MDI2127280.1 hypothetical protein [Yinghuangia seranimata]MDI2132225.1 hypothetical protein [Yinghuangia seranimata]